MGYFGEMGNLKAGKRIEIGAPAAGAAADITTVNDATFSEKTLGDGVAIQPTEGKFYAPCDGLLEAFYPTGHACSVQTDSGAEILIHIGIDTVRLKGRFFTIHAVQGQQVKKGDLLVEVDLESARAAGYDVTTSVVLMNTDHFDLIDKKMGRTDKLQTIFTLIEKRELETGRP